MTVVLRNFCTCIRSNLVLCCVGCVSIFSYLFFIMSTLLCCRKHRKLCLKRSLIKVNKWFSWMHGTAFKTRWSSVCPVQLSTSFRCLLKSTASPVWASRTVHIHRSWLHVHAYFLPLLPLLAKITSMSFQTTRLRSFLLWFRFWRFCRVYDWREWRDWQKWWRRERV